MAIQIAPRPAVLSGAHQSFTETSVSNTIRSSMDNLTVKVRRRTTGTFRTADATAVIRADQYQAFRDWFEVNCQSGVLPTRFRNPHDCKESVWRFTAPPQYEWLDGAVAVRVSYKLEQLPEWRNL